MSKQLKLIQQPTVQQTTMELDPKQCFLKDLKDATNFTYSKERWKDGMHAVDVEHIMNKWNTDCYKGFFGQSELKTHPYLKQIIQEDKPFSLLISTNYIEGTTDPDQESHWVGLFLDNKGSCDYFDSYGLPPIQQSLWDFIERLKEGGTVRMQSKRLQDPLDQESKTCGFHCVVFLLMREHKKIKADEIYKVYLEQGENTHKNDVYAATLCESLFRRYI